MAQRLAKHGSNAGYKAELATGQVCERCRNGHRVYQRQFRPQGKAQGLKYGSYDVIDHLYTQSQREPKRNRARAEPTTVRAGTADSSTEPESSQGTDPSATEPEQSPQRGLAATLADRIRGLSVPGSAERYVNTDEIPDYLHTIEPDPDPDDADSSTVQDESFVITKENMVLIEENMGTYLSVIGMTLEMVDPYCGPILADNFDNIVGRWSKVVSRYPAAARLFMSKGGGTIMDWIGAIQATWPFLYAVYEHHLSHTVITDKGRVMRVTQNGKGPTIDPTMPPPAPDYAYTTQ